MGNQPIQENGRLTLSMPLHVIAPLQKKIILLKQYPESMVLLAANVEATALVEDRVVVAVAVVAVVAEVVVVIIQYPQELTPTIGLQKR